MQVWTTLSDDDIYDVAAEIGVAIACQQTSTEHWNGSGIRRTEIPKHGRAKVFGLRPLRTTKDENGDYRYQRTSASWFNPDRRVFAVCWHGHRDFMRELFKRDPNARIKSHFADYRGAENFEDTYRDTAYITVGAPICPYVAAEVCRCYTHEL